MMLFRRIPTPLSLRRDESGAVAAEFALVLSGLIVLILGTINVCMMMYAATTLHFAAESAARCATVQPTVCTSGYVANFPYAGPAISPTFALTTPACGNQVKGTAVYQFSTGLTTTPVTITATACHPLG